MFFGGDVGKMKMMILVNREMSVFFDRKMVSLFGEMVILFRDGGGCGGEVMLHAGVGEVLLDVVEVHIPVHRRRGKHVGSEVKKRFFGFSKFSFESFQIPHQQSGARAQQNVNSEFKQISLVPSRIRPFCRGGKITREDVKVNRK